MCAECSTSIKTHLRGPSRRDHFKISRADNLIFVSAATLCEISIKKSLGKLVAPDNLNKVVESEQFLGLPITLAHAERAASPSGHHRDPCDRMLVAQAQMEGLALIKADTRFSAYEAEILSA
jgi:PIN domain nuclease of toxin-antitoxin system